MNFPFLMVELNQVLEQVVKENPNNEVSKKTIEFTEVMNKGNLVVSIYPDEKEAFFNGEYTQTAMDFPDIAKLANYLLEQGYSTNLE